MNREMTNIAGSTLTHVKENFNCIKISIASPEKILSWSHGEIKKPETINYRTFKPERDGLFCARIFGPTRDYECLCGKYKRMKYRGVICEKCGVEVTLSRVRRERMGHIKLAAPVAHVWFLKSLPSRIALMLDMPLKDVEAVLYFDSYVITEPGLTEMKMGDILSEEEHIQAQEKHGADSFTASIGAEAVRDMLASIKLEQLRDNIRAEIEKTTAEIRKRKMISRLRLVEAMLKSGNKPEWLIMTVLPVIPPELRPLVPLEGGRFATSDLNDLYRRVINRNNRLKRLIDMRAPDVIIRNEKRMLQEAVDVLFDNGKRGKVITGNNKRPLKSLSDMLKGKEGRFRQNLLGKRVDYSGRSVIVVGPNLKLHQCGLPKKMALELFKPFIYAKLDAEGISTTVKQSKKMLEKERPEVWDILDKVIREHPILLNRAPTLHRLSIQAFEPVLVEGKAIQLHPLVCTAFNADFDGDQMAVHVPLSIEAQLEARVLMMSTNNILHPASGVPVIVPSQDIVLGLYYLSMMEQSNTKHARIFNGIGEVEQALFDGAVELHTPIKARIYEIDKNEKSVKKLYITTPGRMIVGNLLPKKPDISFEICNRLLDKKQISKVIDIVYRFCGQKDTVVFCDNIMRIGFKYGFKAGISFGKDDLVIPDTKQNRIQKTAGSVTDFEKQFNQGLITQEEKYNKVVDAWSKCTDKVAEDMMLEIAKPRQMPDQNPNQEQNKMANSINSVYMMSHSGARSSAAQMKQLAGMRGLMAKPSGEIIETPITSNFKEGLSVIEYFISTHGARKGLADTALKTANSGYLTRRLVDSAQDSIINEDDCKTEQTISFEAIVESGEIIVSLGERVLGRYATEDVLDPRDQSVLVEKEQMINELQAEKINQAGVDSVKVRSPMLCEAKVGVCVKCYGRDLARGEIVNKGEAIGIIAAQSIGEPGTQLTMRTFHVGGTAQVVDQSFVESNHEGIVKLNAADCATNSQGKNVVMGRNLVIHVCDQKGDVKATHKVPYGAVLLVGIKDKIKRGQKIAEWNPYTQPLLTGVGGIVDFQDLREGISVNEQIEADTGIAKRTIIDWKNSTVGAELKPSIVIKDQDGNIKKFQGGAEARYLLSVGAILTVEAGSKVEAGDELVRVPRQSARTRDITGGLPRVSELFEARKPKDAAIIAEISGKIEYVKDYKSKHKIRIVSFDENVEPVEYIIPKGKYIAFQHGDEVEKGDFIMAGTPSPHDILEVHGIVGLAKYLTDEVQSVYRLQGVTINDKHIEVIVRQMLQKVEITNPGDTKLLERDQINVSELQKANENIISQGGEPAQAKPILLGITKSSLHTTSFISAASFQETTRVLVDAAIKGKIDYLERPKENVIVGRLIPAGTGYMTSQYRAVAVKRDELIQEQRKKMQPKQNISEEQQMIEGIEQLSES